jgi:hypothetical protein
VYRLLLLLPLLLLLLLVLLLLLRVWHVLLLLSMLCKQGDLVLRSLLISTSQLGQPLQ